MSSQQKQSANKLKDKSHNPVTVREVPTTIPEFTSPQPSSSPTDDYGASLLTNIKGF